MTDRELQAEVERLTRERDELLDAGRALLERVERYERALKAIRSMSPTTEGETLDAWTTAQDIARAALFLARQKLGPDPD